jgi:hypothetical protein
MVQAITQCMMHAVQCMPLVTSQRGACHTTSAHLVKQSSTKRHSAGQGHPQAKENITTSGRGILCIVPQWQMCVLIQTQQGEANVRKRSWNGDGKETNGHSGTCTARPANTTAGPAHSPGAIATGRSQNMLIRSGCSWLKVAAA